MTYEGEEVRLADGETASFKERDRVGIEFDGEALTYAIPTPFRERSTPDDLMANRNGRFFVAFCKDKTIRLKGAEHGGGLRPSEANAATDLDEFLNKVEGYPVRPIEP